MNRRMLAWVAAFGMVLLAAGCQPTVDRPADGTTAPTTTTTRPTLDAVYQPITLSLGTATAFVGDVVTLPLTVSAEAYLVNADLCVAYDPTVVEPVLTADGALCQKAEWTGGLWSDVKEKGDLRLMLATDTFGDSSPLTLGVLSFRLLKAETAELTLTVSAVGVCAPDAKEGDALAARMVTTVDGAIRPSEESADSKE